MADLPPIPGVELQERIGHGGFAVVYRGLQERLGRSVAVKILLTPVTEGTNALRFERECRTLGSLAGHPNIVSVHDSGLLADGRPFLVMDYVPGGSLASRLAERGMLPWPDVVEMGIKLAEALQAAHDLGVIHRDVKPENVLVSRWGDPLLADFGIAHVQGSDLTRSGVVTASIAFAAPEVLGGFQATPAADVYSLAATLDALLRGTAAFSKLPHEVISAVFARILNDRAPDLRPLGVPDPVARVVELGMAKEPTDRPQSAHAFAELLREAQRTASTPVQAHVPPVPSPPAPAPTTAALGGATLRLPDSEPAPAAPPVVPVSAPITSAPNTSPGINTPTTYSPNVGPPPFAPGGAQTHSDGGGAHSSGPAWATAVSEPQRSKGKRRGIIAVIAASAVIAGAVFALSRGSDDAQPTVDSTLVEVQATKAPTPDTRPPGTDATPVDTGAAAPAPATTAPAPKPTTPTPTTPTIPTTPTTPALTPTPTTPALTPTTPTTPKPTPAPPTAPPTLPPTAPPTLRSTTPPTPRPTPPPAPATPRPTAAPPALTAPAASPTVPVANTTVRSTRVRPTAAPRPTIDPCLRRATAGRKKATRRVLGCVTTIPAIAAPVTAATPEPLPVPPTPIITINRTRVGIGQAVEVSSKNDPRYFHDWLWGDGGICQACATSTSHTYSEAGTFTLTLVLRDSSGRAANMRIPVTVVGPPAVSVDGPEIIGLGVPFTWTSRAPSALRGNWSLQCSVPITAERVEWRPDNPVSQSFVVTANVTNTCTLSLTVEDELGQKATAEKRFRAG